MAEVCGAVIISRPFKTRTAFIPASQPVATDSRSLDAGDLVGEKSRAALVASVSFKILRIYERVADLAVLQKLGILQTGISRSTVPVAIAKVT